MNVRSLFILLISFLFASCSIFLKEVRSPYSNTEKVGTYAHYFLQANPFSKLIIEIDYVSGSKPSPETLDSLTAFLEQRLHKPDGIFIHVDEEIKSKGERNFKAERIQKLERKYRNTFTSDSTLSVYILVLDGSYKKEDLDGIAYNNTSIVLFGNTIQKNYGKLGQPSITTAESAILMHEFGHLFGLVNKGTSMAQNHLELNKGAHCSTQNCLMNSTIRTSDLAWNLNGGIIPKLDSLCIQDLALNGGK